MPCARYHVARLQKQRSIPHKILHGRLRKLTNGILCLVIIMHRCTHSIFIINFLTALLNGNVVSYWSRGLRFKSPVLLMDFSLVGNYSTVLRSWFFCILCPWSVLYCLRRKLQHYTNHRLGKTLKLLPYSYMWSTKLKKNDTSIRVCIMES